MNDHHNTKKIKGQRRVILKLNFFLKANKGQSIFFTVRILICITVMRNTQSGIKIGGGSKSIKYHNSLGKGLYEFPTGQPQEEITMIHD